MPCRALQVHAERRAWPRFDSAPFAEHEVVKDLARLGRMIPISHYGVRAVTRDDER